MNSEQATQIHKYIHDAKNPLNSIALHAELGKMLIEGQVNSDELQNAFTVILEQCRECDRVLGEIRDVTTA